MTDERVSSSPSLARVFGKKANPYTALLSDSISRAGGKVREFSVRTLLFGQIDIWHIHWPDRALTADTYFRILLKFVIVCGLITIARIRGIRIVWTVHNIQSHGRTHPHLERVLMWWLSHNLSGVVTLSPSAISVVVDLLSRAEATTVRSDSARPLTSTFIRIRSEQRRCKIRVRASR